MKYSKYIDHTNLKPDATVEDIKKLCDEAKTYDFASVCVNPGWVSYCKEALEGSDVNVCTVIGFPLGATTSASKAFEAHEAEQNGAKEVDMVINVGRLKAHDDEFVYSDIKAVVDATNVLTKVIIETCLLTDEEKVRACQLAVKAGAEYVKTSTGFSTGGATVADVKLMKETVGDKALVKASGGVHNHEELLAMIEAGASRIGASAGVDLLD